MEVLSMEWFMASKNFDLTNKAAVYPTVFWVNKLAPGFNQGWYITCDSDSFNAWAMLNRSFHHHKLSD